MFHNHLNSPSLLSAISSVLVNSIGDYNLPGDLQDVAKNLAADYRKCETLEEQKLLIENAFVAATENSDVDLDPKITIAFQQAVAHFASLPVAAVEQLTEGKTPDNGGNKAAEVGARDKWNERVAKASTTKGTIAFAKAKTNKALENMKAAGGLGKKTTSEETEIDADSFYSEFSEAAETMTDEQFEEYTNNLSEEQVNLLNAIDTDSLDEDVSPSGETDEIVETTLEDIVEALENFDTEEEAYALLDSLDEEAYAAVEQYFSEQEVVSEEETVEEEDVTEETMAGDILESVQEMDDAEFDAFVEMLDEEQIAALHELLSESNEETTEETVDIVEAVSKMSDEQYDRFLESLSEEEVLKLDAALNGTK